MARGRSGATGPATCRKCRLTLIAGVEFANLIADRFQTFSRCNRAFENWQDVRANGRHRLAVDRLLVPGAGILIHSLSPDIVEREVTECWAANARPRLALEIRKVWWQDAPLAARFGALHRAKRRFHEVHNFLWIFSVSGRGDRCATKIGGAN